MSISPQPLSVPVRSRAQLLLSEVSVVRGGNRVLNEVDLTVTAGSRIGIVGENGRGKSTLLHVLAGRLQPDSGSVSRFGSAALAEQEMVAHEGRTVGEAASEAIAASLAALAELDAAGLQLAAGSSGSDARYAEALEHAESLDAWDAERRIEIALAGLDADHSPSTFLAELSVGQRYRVRLACLLGGDADLLLLDEPTNHLDRAALDFLTERLRSTRAGVVVVSHDRALLSDFARTIVDLDPTPDGRVRAYGGGYEGYREGRAAELAAWEQRYTREQQEMRRLQDDLSAAQNRLTTGWRPDKGTGKHQRASRAGGVVQSVRRRQEALDEHAISTPHPPQRFNMPELGELSSSTLLSGERVSVRGRLETPVDVEIAGGSRLVITGPNGAGKSTLLTVLAGELEPTTGSVRRSAKARIALLRQETHLPPGLTARDAYRKRIDQLAARGVIPERETVGLGALGLLRPSEHAKRIADLSMGQQRRLELALVLATRPHVLLLDEPTNHLSIALVDELTEALRSTPAAVAVSSHDRQLLRDLSDWPRLRLQVWKAEGGARG